MYNYVMLIGRLQDVSDEAKTFTVSVKREFRNAAGEYENDVFEILCNDCIYDIVKDYKEQMSGKMISIKARLQNVHGLDVAVVAERIMFIES